MEVTTKRASLFVLPASKAPTAAVSISIPAPDLNWFVLQKLIPERPCGCSSLAAGSEYTALMYCIYDDIRDRLIGTPDAQLKFKVGSIRCGSQDNMFIISITCQSSLSAVRRVVATAFSRMLPHKLYPKYGKYIGLLGGKANRNEFFNCASRIASQLRPEAVIVGKLKIDKSKVQTIFDTAMKKMPDVSGIPSGTTPSSEEEKRGDTEWQFIPMSGINPFYVTDFLDSINIPNSGANTGVIVYSKKAFKTKPVKIDRYSTKFDKLKDKLVDAVAYAATAGGVLSYDNIKKIASDPPNSAAVAKILKQHLV